jgi:hypothetical protein
VITMPSPTPFFDQEFAAQELLAREQLVLAAEAGDETLAQAAADRLAELQDLRAQA